MDENQELRSLRSKVAALESENAGLKSSARSVAVYSRNKRRWLSALSGLLITLAIVLAPVALLSTWARSQLVDTDRFVSTFAPLAHEPEVQAFVTDQVMAALNENVDVDALVGDLFTGLGQLDMPSTAKSALPLLEKPAALGVRSMMQSGVEQVVASPQFAQLWQAVLRQSHAQAIAVMQNNPDALLKITDESTLTLRLEPIIIQVRQTLMDQGFAFASSITNIDKSVPLLANDSLTLVQVLYQVAVAVGYWMPLALLGMLVAGVLLASMRLHALAWSGAGLAFSFLLFGAGIGISKLVFIGAVSPSVMPAGTAQVMFIHVTQALSATIAALAMLSVFVMLGAWFAGGTRPAAALRGALSSGFESARTAADRHGLIPVKLGSFVQQWRQPLAIATVSAAALVVFFSRPATTGKIIWTVVVVLAVLAAIELLRRPVAKDPDALR